jgi:hypothetical protein
MKKAFFAMFFGIICSMGNVMAQANSPIIGYDKVPWGSDIQSVTQNYPSVREISSEDASLGIKEFEQTNVSSSIKSRKFYFYQNKLYKVFVNYGELESDVGMAILDRIVSTFGKFDDNEEKTIADSGSAGKR